MFKKYTVEEAMTESAQAVMFWGVTREDLKEILNKADKWADGIHNLNSFALSRYMHGLHLLASGDKKGYKKWLAR